MVKRYLVALNIFQRACLIGGDRSSPDSFYIRKIARYLRQGFIRLYMLRDDYEAARRWLHRPTIRIDLESFQQLLDDLEFVLGNVLIVAMERGLVDYARSFSTLLSMDSFRLAAAVLLDVDGIVSMEPEDFVQDPDDIEVISREGRGNVFVQYSENEIGERHDNTMFVATPYSFLLEIDRLFPENLVRVVGDSEGCSLNLGSSRCSIKLRLQDWLISSGKQGVRAVSVVLSHCIESYSYEATTAEKGEIDSLFEAINHCARQLVIVPQFHMSYTATAQGFPGPATVEVGLSYLDRSFRAVKVDDSALNAALEAYVEALNCVLNYSRITFMSLDS